jgi:alanine-synthesizing transaminase
MFSRRIDSQLGANRLSQAIAALRAEGRPFIDLTESNPTRAGFTYPSDLLAGLAAPRGLAYEPEPLGMPDARRAIAADYARRGIEVSPDRIVLTASSSEAYSLVFKVFCDFEDEVLVPRPSYPLFEHLTSLEGVRAVPYLLEYHGSWSVDLGSVERAWSPRVRALLVVSPNNPTGSLTTPAELDLLASRCARQQAALVVDEVFADYRFDGNRFHSAAVASRTDALAISIGGLSKSIGLPQAKLGWMALGGPDALVDETLRRLEFVCDAYLSVSTPVQLAAPDLLTRGAGVRAQIQERVTSNYQRLRERIAASPACTLLRADAGWYAVLQVPTFEPEEELVLTLLMRDGVLTHPGYFFDFPWESYLIVSLLPTAAVFDEGIARVLRHFDCSGPPAAA